MAALKRLAKLKHIMDMRSIRFALKVIQIPQFRRIFGMWHILLDNAGKIAPAGEE